MFLDKLVLEEDIKQDKCKGLFWRMSISPYLSSCNSVEVKKSLRLLKRKSCSGCPTCECVFDQIREDIFSDFDNQDYLDGFEHGKLYTYKLTGGQSYYDTNTFEDDFEFEFIEVKED